MTAWIVADLGFGDSGKGTITDWLVREMRARLVVRWNGGAQAGHTVVTDDGRAHTFSQFGAGTLVPGVRTHLAETFVVHPTALLVEARYLARAGVSDALSRLTLAASARVITPFHQSANRARESARGAARHGTCGVGVGETVRDALEHPGEVVRARDLADPRALRDKTERARERLRASLAGVELGDEAPVWSDPEIVARWVEAAAPLAANVVPDEALGALLRAGGDVVLEGAQGALLDERFGFHPHTTWSDCTARAARARLRAHGWTGETAALGVLRTYLTRHGEGPFPTEAPALGAALPEPHNASAGWQGAFRVGHPDLVLARYAARVSGGLDGLAVTHVDRAAAIDRVGTGYDEAPGEALFVRDASGRAIDLREGDLEHQARLARALRSVRPRLEAPEAPIPELLAAATGAPLLVSSAGPTASAKQRCRSAAPAAWWAR